MSLQFVFRNIESTEAIKSHIEKRVERFTKLITYPVDIQVNLSVEKLEHFAEIICRAEHKQLIGSATTQDLYESIDTAVSRLETQLKKERDLKKGHKSAHLAARPSARKLAQDVGAQIPHMEKKAVNED